MGKSGKYKWFYESEEPLIIIDETGSITAANSAWANLCSENESFKQWNKAGSDYFKLLRHFDKAKEIESLQYIIRYRIESSEQTHQFIGPDHKASYFSIKITPADSDADGLHKSMLAFKPFNLHSIEPFSAENILESMTNGFYLLDKDFKLTYINDIGEKVLQCKRKDVIGKDFWELFPEGKDDSIFFKEYNFSLEHNVERQFESYYAPLDTWFRKKVYPLKNGGLAIYFLDIGEQKLAEQKLEQYAFFDFLTGLPNRRMLTKTLDALKEKKEKFTMFYINLENLNFVNSLYGYNSGDRVLKCLAQRLNELVDEKCTVYRHSGEKFIVILRKPEQPLESFAQKLIGLLEQQVFIKGSQTVILSAHVGIACYPFDTENISKLFSYAETAMFESRKKKGSAYTFFRPYMNAEQARRLKIEEGLLNGLNDSGFYFTLQPQIDMSTGHILGAEVLSRWNHPDLGELSPLEFIEVAEKTGMIVPLTRHLLIEVFTKLKEWHLRYGWDLKIAINMTPSLLSNQDFFNEFLQLMDQFEILPEWIEIEITEQAELTYSDLTLKNLLLCKSKGISIAIDDFGTGYSMISYLTHFPINKIKIDKFFVRKIGTDTKSEAVLKSLIHLAKSIGCDLLAEGVERPEEAAYLKANDCTVFQGYLYDRPMKVHEFEEKYLLGQHQFSMH